MSLKSLIQIIIILIIIIILGGVYVNYFTNNNITSLENNDQRNNEKVDANIEKKEVVKNLSEKTNADNLDVKVNEDKLNKVVQESNLNSEENKEEVNLQKQIKKNKPKVDNIVKDIEYLTTDKNGNKYKILATSGRTNSENKDILDLDNVRGVVTSEKRSTVFIISDFAEYNSSSLNSNFYQNVVINYEDKEITCDYFDVNMKTNIAIAYNNVVVTDPQSIMKAGKIILNIETKVLNINPENENKKVSLTIN